MKNLMVLHDKHEVTIDDVWRIDKSIGVKYKGCKVIIVIVLSKMMGGERGGIMGYKRESTCGKESVNGVKGVVEGGSEGRVSSGGC